MLHSIGRRAPADDTVGRLAACHERIRHFLAVAGRLVKPEGRSPTEIAEAAEAVRTYFVSSLPAHVRDEEEVILPWMKGRSPEIDAALATMHEEHLDHEYHVSQLVRICREIVEDPEASGPRGELGAALETLGPLLERHLVTEEATVFPALRALDADEQGYLLRALRRAHGEG